MEECLLWTGSKIVTWIVLIVWLHSDSFWKGGFTVHIYKYIKTSLMPKSCVLITTVTQVCIKKFFIVIEHCSVLCLMENGHVKRSLL